MNPVDICNEVTELCEAPFDAAEFPFQFLAAFGNKETVLKRLRTGNTNKSDIGGSLLQNNIHIKICDPGDTTATLAALRDSPANVKAKAKFILTTDGLHIEAEELASGETVHCAYAELSDHFGFFLPLAGITTVKAIRESSFDIKATGKLNQLYVELLKENPDWARPERRPDMNHFMARLIFCFFAEDTGIIHPSYRFSETVQKMSATDGTDTHEVIETLFRAMNTPTRHEGNLDNRYREAAGIPAWANNLPYVNGQLFSGNTDVPRFSRFARSILIHVGGLNWNKINPDIFGSMIQAVADDEERGALGMHYTSVPNILKVLNPLFLDDLRGALEEAGDNGRKLLNLRNRMAKIRVFDPACGSGNFLVIAYKEMRAIEAVINQRRDEEERRSDIPLTNFRGIELRDFPAEIARLALIIAEYQCDVTYRGQKEALATFLPLDAQNWIVRGNALQLDWLTVCEPTGKGGGKIFGDDLFGAPLDQAKIDFENEGGETYICGNPPYLGSTWQDKEQKADLERIFGHRTKSWKSLDYVAGWFMKAADYGLHTPTVSAFVSTNSICQGQQVPILWPLIFGTGHHIAFAHTSFKWNNLASHNAGVTVVIVAVGKGAGKERALYSVEAGGATVLKRSENINAYLVAGQNVIVDKLSQPLTDVSGMDFGSKPVDGGNLFLDFTERLTLIQQSPDATPFVHEFSNSEEFINGKQRFCLWIGDDKVADARNVDEIARRLDVVAQIRLASPKLQTQQSANTPHRFGEVRHRKSHYTIVVPRVSSENREFLPVGLVTGGTIIGDRNFALYDAPLWNMALVASRLHWVWIGTVCVRLEMRFSYSNTLGWNTFPVPTLTEQNRADLTRCAEDILLAREAHFPKTIADLYDPKDMPENLRRAHDANDEVLERIYIGRRFKNDTERLEKLFELYTKMTSKAATSGKAQKA
jgi:hypothetical protein